MRRLGVATALAVLVLVCSGTPAAANRPHLSVSPSQGPAGTSVVATGDAIDNYPGPIVYWCKSVSKTCTPGGSHTIVICQAAGSVHNNTWSCGGQIPSAAGRKGVHKIVSFQPTSKWTATTAFTLT